jgi:hypothetical protein
MMGLRVAIRRILKESKGRRDDDDKQKQLSPP